MMAEDYGVPTKSSILLYPTEDGRQRIEVRLENETVWLSQRLLAELFQKDVRTINEHIKNIYDEYELLPESTIRNFRIVQTEGNRQVSRTVDSNAGRISSEMARELAHVEYDAFSNKRRQIEANKADEELREATKKLTSKESTNEGNQNG
jgi:hypothetical protein